MKIVRDRSYTGQRVLLDGKTFINCQFQQCTLVVEGKNLFSIETCNISEDCKFAVEGPGKLILDVLKLMLHGGGWFQQVAENVIDHVRRPPKFVTKQPVAASPDAAKPESGG